jgi:hypothetical protein
MRLHRIHLADHTESVDSQPEWKSKGLPVQATNASIKLRAFRCVAKTNLWKGMHRTVVRSGSAGRTGCVPTRQQIQFRLEGQYWNKAFTRLPPVDGVLEMVGSVQRSSVGSSSSAGLPLRVVAALNILQVSNRVAIVAFKCQYWLSSISNPPSLSSAVLRIKRLSKGQSPQSWRS